MTTEELLTYYASLLIMQYYSKPRAVATVKAFVEPLVADQVADAVYLAYDVDTAVGDQLDVLAGYRGLTRLVYGIDLSREYLTMPDYGDADEDTVQGFYEYGDTPLTAFFLTYKDASVPLYAMSDDELRRMIKLRTETHKSIYSLGEVDDILYAYFGDDVALYDNGDMTITYIILETATDTLFGIANATNSLPKPSGVRINAIRADALTGFFGFQNYSEADDPAFVGYGEYGTPQTGSFVRYP